MLKDSCSKSLIESGNQMYHEHERTEMRSNPMELVYVLRRTGTFMLFQ